MAQWLSAIVGATVNKTVGKDAAVGAATAQYGMKWNATRVHPTEEGANIVTRDVVPL